MSARIVLATATTLLTACLPAYGKGGHAISAETPQRLSPYQVDMITASGATLPVYTHRGRYYIMGQVGERYSLRVRNPTPQRVEAVVSVDGLDVVDGKTAAVSKRGYIVPAYGELVLDGWRVSMDEVAAFRFSSVRDSYAGRKGQARNVGVIGVAVFAEKAPPPSVYLPRREQDDSWDYDDHEASPTTKSRAPSGGEAGAASEAPAASSGGARPSAAPPAQRGATDSLQAESECRDCGRPNRDRPGLGTEWGEYRGSRVQFVTFERAHETRPTAYLEFRYNDRQGLIALGIPIEPAVPDEELELRESATPFPATFATPPPSR